MKAQKAQRLKFIHDFVPGNEIVMCPVVKKGEVVVVVVVVVTGVPEEAFEQLTECLALIACRLP
ncbi:hypothetical protein E2C01_089299 [Portunus trituberculatus]|uniref:Uncharacterized protein n=1 Tax=Portunus trituberculatus TaxID=210409 RepID=A0A5B7JHT2_PORTR|nr:hypothetical protein [Portunus trituberculatus]